MLECRSQLLAVGGLSAAIALRSLGLQVIVFEQGRQIAELGAGINFSPAAVSYLNGLGLDSEFGDVSQGDGIETSTLHYMTPDGLTIDAEPRACCPYPTLLTPSFS